MKHVLTPSLWLLVVLALTLSGCYVGELPSCESYLQSNANGGLPYNTIEWSGGGSEPGQWEKWPDAQPGLRVIVTPDDIPDVTLYISDKAEETLRQLDYTTHFAVIAFSGRRTPSMCITQLARQDSKVVIHALVVDKGFGPAVELSPYHLIQVEKRGEWNAQFAFTLAETSYKFSSNSPIPVAIWEDLGVVASVSHYIP